MKTIAGKETSDPVESWLQSRSLPTSPVDWDATLEFVCGNETALQSQLMKYYDIPYYLDFLPPKVLERLVAAGESVGSVPGLTVAPGLQSSFPNIETDEALGFTCELYRVTHSHLNRVLNQRQLDREFLDQAVARLRHNNEARSIESAEYESVIGMKDAKGRTVIGPLGCAARMERHVSIPEFLDGFQLTLFGPPDTARMSINAMNALNRRPPDEQPIVTELVSAFNQVPRWGADNEDSKTPIMANFLRACENLIGCFDRTLRFQDESSGKLYRLDESGLSIPIKRIPGLALPDGSHLLNGNPIPLHLYDFAMHLFHNWSRPEALVFYIPKLENEEEAEYLRHLIETAETNIKRLHPEYELGTVRLFIVFENPRAIFRIREMATALNPYFLGGSLGWHDFLGSTARLFKNDPNYRIPVKADPNIVINHIRESHHILVEALKPLGGLCIGGMYGVLYEDGNPASYQVSMVGYIKDVVTQLKRGLAGFWVAHPTFVRPGMAIVEALQRREQNADDPSLTNLICALVAEPSEQELLIRFVEGPDVRGLPTNDPRYERAVLAATLRKSNVIANDDPEEVRYNVFQIIQYLAAWLSGNGCVALPATMTNSKGEEVFVRIMDDLATTERSRWELWAEINHGRVSLKQFEQILAEEVEFIRNDRATPTKRVQVKWQGENAKWYPIAEKLVRQLVTAAKPVEFATELLLPFTLDFVRASDDPWATVNELI